ncbi:MAG: hypothetical protein OEZ43_18185 [Gammaproteobacteria bacterium]|nr:hypothetical protein [Gammaproteobacteria bacterium]
MTVAFRIVLSLLIIPLACSRLPQEEPTEFPIHAVWEGACANGRQGSVTGSLATVSKRTTYTFFKDQAIRIDEKFNKNDCLQPNRMWSLRMQGNFSIDTSLAPEPVMQPIDFSFKRLEAIAHSTGGTEDLQYLYGTEVKYEIDKAVNITYLPHNVKMVYFDVYQISDEKLHLGLLTDQFDGETEATRPVEIATGLSARVFVKSP